MKWGYLILKASGAIEVVESDDCEFTLDELYLGANCDTIQIVSMRYDKDLLMCIDDNGKILRKNVNLVASMMYAPGLDFIVGDAVIGTRNCIDPYAEPDIYKMPLDECLALKEKLEKLK